MNWDEKLFYWAAKGIKKLKPKKYFESRGIMAFDVEGMAPQLQYLAAAVNQSPLRIEYSDLCFGWTPQGIVIPRYLFLFKEEKASTALLTTQIIFCIKAYQLHRKHTAFSKNDFQFNFQSAPQILEQVRSLSLQEFSGIQDKLTYWQNEFKTEHLAHMKRLVSEHPWNERILMAWDFSLPETVKRQFSPILMERVSELSALMPMPIPSQLITGLHSDPNSSDQEIGTGHEAKASVFKAPQSVKLITIDEKQNECNPVHHNLEKLLTADDYKGGVKQLDGEDELEDHQEALEEVNLSQVIRSSEQTKGLYKSNAFLNLDFAESPEQVVRTGHFQYDEWNHKKKNYIKNWCQLNEYEIGQDETSSTSQALVANNESTYQVKKLKRQLQSLFNERRNLPRQMDGEEIDLDSAIDHLINLRSHHNDSERYYTKKAQTEQSFSVLILQDLSLSMDSWIDNRRVLDVCAQSLLVIGQALDNYEKSVGIFGFSGNTHRDCRFIKIKDFTETWPKAQQSIQQLRPAGYTRIGPAIRHAHFRLKKKSTKTKMILVLTDGRPNDYDPYEGTYGLQDVKKAVEECRQEGIAVKCLSLDRKSAAHMSQMFQSKHFYTLLNMANLPDQLFGIFKSAIKP